MAALRAAGPPTGITTFGGGPLIGTKLVRVIYLDETGHCFKAADIFMVNGSPADEVAMVIAEERNEARRALRAAHNLALNRKLVEQWLPEFAHLFPILRVKAPPAFASKEEEILLQMADAC